MPQYNVKTVLFKDEDKHKTCWYMEELNMLIARRIMQDLIPKKETKDFKSLLKYIKRCMDKAETNNRLVKSALYDALGGYLHTVVPILNHEFYAGNVEFKVASELHSSLDSMKDFLSTNGNRWIRPCEKPKIGTNSTLTKIPIPYLDDDKNPNSIAVPFKDRSLFSLNTECSVNIIPKYYILSMRCLVYRYKSDDIVKFNHYFYKWIEKKVLPHLGSRWYPGFGGVLKVVETMKERGLISTEKTEVHLPDVSDCPLDSIKLERSKNIISEDVNYFDSGWSWKSILWLVSLIALAFWLMYCFVWILLIKIRKNKNKGYVTIKTANNLSRPRSRISDFTNAWTNGTRRSCSD